MNKKHFKKVLFIFFCFCTVFLYSATNEEMPISEIIEKMQIGEEYRGEKYNRKEWKNWIDADRDCQKTRDEVLIEESLEPVAFKTAKGCKVVSGLWYDPYTGQHFKDPKILDIDHMIPLKEAFLSGGYAWNTEKKKRYYNDLEDSKTLIAVHRSANRSKGSRSPDKYLPPNKDYVCEYVKNWASIKIKWEFTFDEAEANVVKEILEGCVDQ